MKKIKIKYLFQYEVVVKTSIKVWDNQQRFTINSIRRSHVRLARDCKQDLEITHR